MVCGWAVSPIRNCRPLRSSAVLFVTRTVAKVGSVYVQLFGSSEVTLTSTPRIWLISAGVTNGHRPAVGSPEGSPIGGKLKSGMSMLGMMIGGIDGMLIGGMLGMLIGGRVRPGGRVGMLIGGMLGMLIGGMLGGALIVVH